MHVFVLQIITWTIMYVNQFHNALAILSGVLKNYNASAQLQDNMFLMEDVRPVKVIEHGMEVHVFVLMVYSLLMEDAKVAH